MPQSIAVSTSFEQLSTRGGNGVPPPVSSINGESCVPTKFLRLLATSGGGFVPPPAVVMSGYEDQRTWGTP